MENTRHYCISSKLSDNIKIAAIVPYKVFPAKMGGQKGIAFFYRYLSKLLPVTIISVDDNEPPVDERFDVQPLLGKSILRYINPLLFFKLKKSINENKFTHLILEHPYYGWLGWLLKKSTGIKLVIHSHNIESIRFKSTGRWWWPILWRYEKFIHQHADFNFFITDEDRSFAAANFKLESKKCFTITYGFELKEAPSDLQKKVAKEFLQKQHNIGEVEKILLFNGTLDYKPNLDAVDIILQTINSLLLANKTFKYKIIICGRGLPESYNELKSQLASNIIYAGFVNDINVYFAGADIFINPVTDGGGIKTKLVEALGFDVSCVSTASGATGVPLSVTGNKMIVTGDRNDWINFANAIITTDPRERIPNAFFEHFYWGNIAEKVKAIINS